MKMRSRLIYDSGSSWLQGLAAGQDFIWIDLHMARSHVTYRCRFLLILFSSCVLVMFAMFVILAFCTGYALLLNGVADPLISCICSTHDLCLHSGGGVFVVVWCWWPSLHIPICLAFCNNLYVLIYTSHMYAVHVVICYAIVRYALLCWYLS